MAIEASAALACLITAVRSAVGFFSASSIAVTASLTLATAASVFGKPTDLARYSPIEAEILERRLRSSSAFFVAVASADAATAASVVAVVKLFATEVGASKL